MSRDNVLKITNAIKDGHLAQGEIWNLIELLSEKNNDIQKETWGEEIVDFIDKNDLERNERGEIYGFIKGIQVALQMFSDWEEDDIERFLFDVAYDCNEKFSCGGLNEFIDIY